MSLPQPTVRLRRRAAFALPTSARMFAQAGAKIVAVQDVGATVYNPAGLDVAALKAYLTAQGTLAGAPATVFAGDALPAAGSQDAGLGAERAALLL